MSVDPENPVVKLCVEGLRAEGDGRAGDARALFLRAWAASGDDLEACIAAHYVARHQPTPADTLGWNREALRRADAVGDERVRGFYPSLLLNVADSHEKLGDLPQALEHYRAALARMDDPAAPPHEAHVRASVVRALERLGAASGASSPGG
jgi:tetratricopeptide (TPR) repeat protein